jgi:hypothetical protein
MSPLRALPASSRRARGGKAEPNSPGARQADILIYVRGEARDTSDLDLLVEFSETPDIFKFMDLEEDLTAFLGLK